MLKEARTGYRGMYTNLNGTKRFCLVYFDNDGRVIGYYDRGNFVWANGEAWVCKDGEFKSLPTSRYMIDCRDDKEAIKYFMYLCENIFEKDDYSGMVGG